jgi:hypothetical protein
MELRRDSDYRMEGRSLSLVPAEEPEQVPERLTSEGEGVWGVPDGGSVSGTWTEGGTVLLSEGVRALLIELIPAAAVQTELPWMSTRSAIYGLTQKVSLACSSTDVETMIPAEISGPDRAAVGAYETVSLLFEQRALTEAEADILSRTADLVRSRIPQRYGDDWPPLGDGYVVYDASAQTASSNAVRTDPRSYEDHKAALERLVRRSQHFFMIIPGLILLAIARCVAG